MLRLEIKRKIIQYIVNKLTAEGFSVGCYCVDDCINMYVQKEKHYVTSIISLAILNGVENKQCYIDYCISGIIEQFNTGE